MEPGTLRWTEVHRHIGSSTALAWSPSGRYLCCASFDGAVSVLDADTWAVVRLIEPQPAAELSRPYGVADWDRTRDAVAVETPTGFKVIDLHGREISAAESLRAWRLRARPVFGGYACVQHDDQGRHSVAITDKSGAAVQRLKETCPQVQDLAWSPDGRLLAIVCDWGVSVHSWELDNFELTVPGGPSHVAWLDATRLAVGCMDTAIRVYAGTHKPALVDVLEAHDGSIVGFGGPNAAGEFASVDDESRVCVWMPDVPGHRLAHSHVFERQDMFSTPAIALHPTRPVVAVDVDRTVWVANGIRATQLAAPSREAQGEPSVLDTVLLRAGIDGARIHCDTLGRAWDVGANPSHTLEERMRRTRACKHIAAATRSLLHDVSAALRMLWGKPVTAVRIELEEIAGPTMAGSNRMDVRRRLLALLATELQADRPRLRSVAAAAYVGIGHLGVEEIGTAFGRGSLTKALLPLMDERLRRYVHAGVALVAERDVKDVASAVHDAAAAVAQAISQARSQQGNLLTTDTPHTLILKGGGAKGLAHVGALQEIRRYYPCDRFAGTSAGAIVAVLLGAGMSDDELESALMSTDFAALVHEPWLQCVLRLLLRGGWHSGNGIQDWLDRLLAKKLDSPTQVTLGQLPMHTILYACQGHDPTVTFDSLAPATTAEPASYAVRCSMSIPFYFTPELKSGLHIFDGVLHQNYPVEELLAHAPETPFIGLYLGMAVFEPRAGTGPVRAFYESLLEANDKAQLKKHSDRTVIIDTRPIGTLDFKLSGEEKRFLVLAGRVAALKFLKRHGVDLSDRVDMGDLSKEHDALRTKLLQERTRRATRRRRVSWVVVVFTVAWAIWHWQLWRAYPTPSRGGEPTTGETGHTRRPAASPRDESRPLANGAMIGRIRRWVPEDVNLPPIRTSDPRLPFGEPLEIVKLSRESGQVAIGDANTAVTGTVVVRDSKGQEYTLVLIDASWRWDVFGRTERDMLSEHVRPYWTIAVTNTSVGTRLVARLISVDTGHVAWGVHPDDVTLSVGPPFSIKEQ